MYFQVLDYAIARKLVALHNNVDDSNETPYTQEEVLRYITFARQFKPIISEVINLLFFFFKEVLKNTEFTRVAYIPS